MNALDCKANAPQIEPMNTGHSGAHVPEQCPKHEGLYMAVEDQSDVAASAPSSKLPAPGTSDRGAHGRFREGNTVAMKHGRHSARVLAGEMPEQAEAAKALQERAAAIVADLGGVDSLGALGAEAVTRHVRLGLVEEFLFARLQQSGPLTGKGKTRAALTAWLQVVDRMHRSATTLGLDRRARPIFPASPAEAARQALTVQEDR